MLTVSDGILEDAGNKPNASTAYDCSGTAETGFRTFASVMPDGGACIVLAEQVDANGNPSGAWEITYCTFTDAATDTLTRGTLLSSSSGSKIDWSAATGLNVTPRLALVSAAATLPQTVQIDTSGTPTTIETPTLVSGFNYLIQLHEIVINTDNRNLQLEFSTDGGSTWSTTNTTWNGFAGGTWSSGGSTTGAGIFYFHRTNEALGSAAGEQLSAMMLLFDPAGSGRTCGIAHCHHSYYSGGARYGSYIANDFNSDEAHNKARLSLSGSGTFTSGVIHITQLGAGFVI